MKIVFASLVLLLALSVPSAFAEERSLSTSEQEGWGSALKNPAGPLGNQGFVSSAQPLKPPSVYQEQREKQKEKEKEKEKEEEWITIFNEGGPTDESQTREERRESRRKRRSLEYRP